MRLGDLESIEFIQSLMFSSPIQVLQEGMYVHFVRKYPGHV